MKLHRNAALSWSGRRRLVRQVVSKSGRWWRRRGLRCEGALCPQMGGSLSG